ncbi:hypothetical protein B0T14DRAFT_435392 [Immersiella caudata]|uniref:Uncharacterized protein n=1 Tax=Immersiella caudata TaxID=314043 RepID=A0AA40BXF5_9PEZI|nr:hypothetical protein B0T14DRAFT_435392 [Immersiella caudata]
MADNQDGDNGPSPVDVITYIGVPLAVLGVLPILYNTIFTLAALSKIKRMLRHSKLTALTRSDVVNRVIEIELPRYAVQPLDRFNDRSEYWTLSRHPSSIPGGSWTTFNWRTNVIGLKSQRVEYADQLRQPQVEVAFDELICYLLDLGAVPDPHGWRLLRSTGLWTPVGCALMTSPDGKEKALTLAPLDGSDGHLSLAASWSSSWTTRDYSHLPPYWVRLPPPPPQRLRTPAAEAETSAASIKSTTSDTPDADPNPFSGDAQKHSLDSISQHATASSRQPITCQISSGGIITALSQETQLQSTIQLDSLYIDHIRIRPSSTNGIWFASAATAYGTSSQTILWNYKIPDDILSFARKETVPCGVLVLLKVADESATPEWATKYEDHGAQLDAFARRAREQREAMMAEAKMPPAQRAQAARDRAMRENQARMDEMRDKMRLENQRRETRVMEAIQSPKWDTKIVAGHNFAWLKARGEIQELIDMREYAGTLLHRMVLDGQFASSVCRMLDLWKAWAENGGMRKSDLTALEKDQAAFAQASVLLSLIKDTSGALEGTLSMDLQECMRLWRIVRLG